MTPCADKPDEELAHEGNQFRKILKHSPWYLVSSLLTKAIGFFLLPVYTHYLSPEDYGLLANLESFGRVVPIFLSLYMDSAFLRFYYHERSVSSDNVKRLYSTHFFFIAAWGVVVALCLIELAPQILNNLAGIPFWPVVVVIMTQLLSQLSLMVMAIWRADLKARKVSLYNIILSISSIALGLVLLIQLDMGWVSRIYASGSIALIQAIFLLSIAIRNGWLSVVFDFSMFRRSLIYAIPLIPNVAAGWIAGFSDRLILSYYGKLEEAGLYSIAFQVAYILYVFNDAITQVQGPISMSGLTSHRERAKTQIEEFLTTFVWSISLLYVALSLFSKEIFVWFLDERFHEAWKLVFILGIIYILSGIYRVFTTIILFHNKTWIISSAAIIQAVVNILLNLSLIPIFGMFAAACSTVISLFFYTAWIITWSQRLFYVRIPISELFTIFIISIVVLAGGRFVDVYQEVSYLSVIFKLCLFGLFFSTLLFPVSSQIRDAFSLNISAFKKGS